MKKIILIFVLIQVSILNLNAQDKFVQVKDGSYLITGVVTLDSISSKEMYRRALSWVSEEYKNPKEVIQTQDAEAGLLAIKGIITLLGSSKYEHKLTFQFKEGKYKWTISDIYIIFPEFTGLSNKRIETVPRYNRMDNNSMDLLYKDFTDYINSFNIKIQSKDNW